ncbi:MAG: beta-ribofuranosylaminobenzene 5'-phosphate synthase family protein, partial [Methylophilaceae bacterium]
MTKKNSGLFRIQAHARLHLGFFDLHGGLGRKFGSLGLALANPVTELEAYASATLQIKGDVDAKSRETISKIIQNLRNHFNLQASCSFNIKQLIPNHVGFGSGTQLALSVVALFNKLYDLNMSQTEISAFSGRGARSGIGLGTFFQGGVVVDAGRSAGNPIPPVIARMNFPEEWRILLIRDNQQVGIYGQLELEAFNQLPEFPPALAAKLCRHVLMQALPALYERDLPSFGEAVNALQLATGEHFASAQ